jgi:hypothetical protein
VWAADNFGLVSSASGLSISVDFTIVIAALVVFQSRGFFVGAAIVGSIGALYLPNIRDHVWHKLVINSSIEWIGLLPATAASWAIAGTGHADVPVVLLAVGVATLIYLAVNLVLVSVPISLATGQSYWQVVRADRAIFTGTIPFAILGLGFGYIATTWGAAVLVLSAIPTVIARQSYKAYLQLSEAQDETIATLIRALEAKDPYTAGHAQRVAKFSEYIGEELTLSPRRMERLRYAALMHDIGKLIVPNQLLNKPGRLTEAEFARVRAHEHVSVELLQRIEFLAPIAGDTTTEAASAAVWERMPIEPAIIHVADAFDAMTSTRSYRRALSQDTAFGELRTGTGSQFNGTCVEALIAAIDRRGERYGEGYETEQLEWAVEPPKAGTGSAGLGHLLPDANDAPPVAEPATPDSRTDA